MMPIGTTAGNIPLHNLRHANGPDYIIKSDINGKAVWGLPSNGTSYQIVFGSGLSFQYELNTFPFAINSATFYNPDGEEVSVLYKLTDKLYIESNVNLLNHILILK